MLNHDSNVEPSHLTSYDYSVSANKWAGHMLYWAGIAPLYSTTSLSSLFSSTDN